ncbi:MAG: BrnT family toxin [Casimicrobiaceae bacterium]
MKSDGRSISKSTALISVSQQGFLGPVLEAVDDRENYAETRFRALGKVGDICFMVIYTRRGETRRLISAWKAGRNEQERYENLFPG